MPKYKIELDRKLELPKLNLIENQKIKESCMSILSYMLKKNLEENDQLKELDLEHLKKDKHKFEISYRNFLKLYNKGHKDKKLSIRTLKNRIDLLKELGLIKVEQSKNSFSYYFCRYLEVNKKVNTLNDAPGTQNTNLNVVDTEHKYLNTKSLDLDSSNNSTNITYPKNYFVKDTLEKCSSWEDIKELLFMSFKAFKIKSMRLKGIVIEKIERNLNNITKKFAKNYIEKVIIQIKTQEKRRRIAYAKAIKIAYDNSQNDSFNNYNQRSYNYDELEKKLLGWN